MLPLSLMPESRFVNRMAIRLAPPAASPASGGSILVPPEDFTFVRFFSFQKFGGTGPAHSASPTGPMRQAGGGSASLIRPSPGMPAAPARDILRPSPTVQSFDLRSCNLAALNGLHEVSKGVGELVQGRCNALTRRDSL